MQPAEQLRGDARLVESRTDLGEDVEGVLVTGVMQRPVPRWLRPSEAGRRSPEQRRAAVHAERLVGHRYVGVTGAHEQRVEVVPIRGGLTLGDIHPLDHDRAVERRSWWASDEDPG